MINSTSTTQIDMNNIELEGNIGEGSKDTNKVKNLVETNKPSDQTKAAFGYVLFYK
jgi:hypothetical protein